MISGWLRHLELTLKSKSGLGSSVFIWGLIALLGGAVTLGFFIFAAFIALAGRFGPLTAAAALGALFLLLTLLAVLGCVSSRRRTIAGAQLALEARSHAPWLDPKFVGLGLQIGRAIGWRRLVPLAAAGVLVAGLAKEWYGRDHGAAGEAR
jgi:hypothetical protein